MNIKELSKFIDRTLDKWRYPSSKKYSDKERIFAQMIKISEETGELSEQVLWKFGWQRIAKKDKISDEKLENEIADVILATVRLGRLLDMDIESVLDKKIEILKCRFWDKIDEDFEINFWSDGIDAKEILDFLKNKSNQ